MKTILKHTASEGTLFYISININDRHNPFQILNNSKLER